jgi:hypothetical protein
VSLLVVNAATNALVASLNSPQQAVESVPQNRGASGNIGVVFGYPFGTAIELESLGGLTEFKFGAKVLGDYNGPFVVSNYNPGTGLFPWVKTQGYTFSDGVTTGVNTAYSSATASFAQSDVGCGIAGANLAANTTIAAVTSATTIVLSQNALGAGAGQGFVITPQTVANVANRTPTYTVSPAWNTTKLNNLLGYDPNGFGQETNVWAVADVNGSLSGAYFDISDKNGPVRFYFSVTGVGYDIPAAPARGRLIAAAIVLAENANGTAVAAAIAAAAAADAAGATWSAVAIGDLAQITDVVIGPRSNAPDAGTASGFEVEIWIAGSAPNTLTEVESVTLGAQIEYTAGGQVYKVAPFEFEVFAAYINGNEGVPVMSNPSYPAPGAIVTFDGTANALAEVKFVATATGVKIQVSLDGGSTWHDAASFTP